MLGQLKVQGLDYAYTLQGWLKGVNSSQLDPSRDMGGDGASGGAVARDVFGFALHYNQQDYKPIVDVNGTTIKPFAEVTGSFFRQLYNGNIGAMTVNIGKFNQPLLYNYGYDQLNRIISMDAYNGLSSANSWGSATILQDYKERVTYDPNGNIVTYERNGYGSNLPMDDLTYHYLAGTNKLQYVTDAISVDAYTEDIGTQQATNYDYDPIGNLIQDQAEGITSIEWNVYGKISRIYKGTNNYIEYGYDAGGNRIYKNAFGVFTVYVRDASGNVMSIYEKRANEDGELLRQTELHIYGSSRLGILKTDLAVEGAPDLTVQLPLLTERGRPLGFERGAKRYELTNHLGNVLVTISDKRVGVPYSNSFMIDYYEAVVISAQDYYPFGMMMPERVYSADGGYRYGFNGQEKSKEISEAGNSYFAEFWEYNPKVGRRWNVDPINFHSQSIYSCFNNNPNYYVDPDGLYSSKDRAEKMRHRALKAGKNVGEVRYREKHDDWIFTETRVSSKKEENGQESTIVSVKIHSKDRYFGGAGQIIGDFFSDINPFGSVEGYFGVAMKTEISVRGGTEKIVVPYGGVQIQGKYKNGKFSGSADIVDGRQSYINIRRGNYDVRLMPLSGIGGDYEPGARILYTVIKRPIVIPVGDVPVPIGESKLQGDFVSSNNKATIGLRGVAESFLLPSLKKNGSGVRFELNVGIRFQIQVPDIFKN